MIHRWDDDLPNLDKMRKKPEAGYTNELRTTQFALEEAHNRINDLILRVDELAKKVFDLRIQVNVQGLKLKKYSKNHD